MSTESSWFFCGECGFRNHPRINGGASLKASVVADQAVDTAVCEQCGAGNSHGEAAAYAPGATNA